MRGSWQVGDRVERFTLGPDLLRVVDDRGDEVEVHADGRVRLVLDGWELRGGRVGDRLHWVRGEDEHTAVAAGFTGSSPVWDLSTAAALALAVGESRTLVQVELTGPVGAALTVRRAWSRTAGPEADVDRFEVADLDTGERSVVHVSAGVLVSREGPDPAYLLALTR